MTEEETGCCGEKKSKPFGISIKPKLFEGTMGPPGRSSRPAAVAVIPEFITSASAPGSVDDAVNEFTPFVIVHVQAIMFDD